jgi:hypothetical protein
MKYIPTLFAALLFASVVTLSAAETGKTPPRLNG